MTTTNNKKIERLLQPKEPQYSGVHPLKFLVWLIIISSIMFFGAITSSIIVRSADGQWIKFDLPFIFYVSTALALLSSLTAQLAYISAKKDEIGRIKLFSALTLVLGIAFLSCNYQGWMQLAEKGFALSNNIDGGQSASFFHFSTYVHAAHVLLGLAFVGFTLFRTFQYKVHRKSLLTINISTTYWHFVDLLWIYLFLFLILSL